MSKPNQRHLLIIFTVALFIIFLFSMPQKTHATIFTAGYYENHPVVIDNTCEPGYWRARVDIKDYDGNELMADEIRVEALFYPKLPGGGYGSGQHIYGPETITNATSFETPCEIPIKDSDGLIDFEITAEKHTYYAIKANNPSRFGGSEINQRKWIKTLYLADLITAEANTAFIFPDNGMWISGREEHSEMKLFVNNSPRPESITEIEIEIIHTNSGQKFFLSKKTNISEGEEIFRLPALTAQGEYSWRVVKMMSTPSIFYNENNLSYFRFDSIPPESTMLSGYGSRKSGTKEQKLVVTAEFEEYHPASGVDIIEIYLNDGPRTPLNLVRTCVGGYGRMQFQCFYDGDEYKEYDVPKTYTIYSIGYDRVGHRTVSGNDTFTVRPIPDSITEVKSNVSLIDNPGAFFEIKEIDPDISGVPEPGIYKTTKTFTGSYDYEVVLEAPDNYKNQPFTFWKSCRSFSSSCPPKSLTWSRTINLNSKPELCMYFGASVLNMPRFISNYGAISSTLRNSIDSISVKVTQEGGTPINLFGPRGQFFSAWYYKWIAGKMDNLILKFHDSDNGILRFDVSNPERFGTSPFCESDPENERQCQGSIVYDCGRIQPRYLILRTVRVETYLGDSDNENSVGGVEIFIDKDKEPLTELEGGITNAEGYYDFSSTAHPQFLSGTFWAPDNITIGDDKFAFGYWSGCDRVSENALGCYIGTKVSGNAWYYSIATTLKAHYSGSPSSPNPQFDVEINGTGNGTVTSDPLGINCNKPGCSALFNFNQSVQLTAITDVGSEFTGWEGACAAFGTNTTCTVVMDSDKVVGAEFAAITYDLTINSTAGGQVTNPGEGAFTYNPGQMVNLEAERDPGYRFVNWTGDTGTIADVNAATTTITMNGDYTITANFEYAAPRAVNLDHQHLNYCESYVAPVSLTWTFESSDPDPGVEQGKYEVQVATDFAFNDIIAESGEVPTKNNSWGVLANSPHLLFNETYYWRVRVWDNNDNRSDCGHADGWCHLSPTSFTTLPEHPWPRFDWIKPSIVGEVTQLCSIFEAGVCEIAPPDGWTNCPFASCNWAWSFDNATPLTSNSENPQVTFNQGGDNKVNLEVCDPSNTYCCPEDKDIHTNLPLPEYREVRPRSQLDNFLARLSSIFVRL